MSPRRDYLIPLPSSSASKRSPDSSIVAYRGFEAQAEAARPRPCQSVSGQALKLPIFNCLVVPLYIDKNDIITLICRGLTVKRKKLKKKIKFSVVYCRESYYSKKS